MEKRTVEGDLGMRYSALSLLESVTYQAFHPFTQLADAVIKKECHKRAHQPDFVSQSLEEMAFDNILGKIADKTAV